MGIVEVAKEEEVVGQCKSRCQGEGTVGGGSARGGEW